MNRNFNKKQIISIALLVAVGALLPAVVLNTGNSQPGQTEDAQLEQANPNEPVKGPKGGKYFVQDGYGVEVTIFEDGVEPEFRIYTYKDGTLLPPEVTKASIELERLGRKTQTINFAPANDFLRGDAVVFEPHSFRIAVNAQHQGKQYRFTYDQIEYRIDMSEEQMKQSGIELATAGPARVKSSIELIGEIQFNRDNTVRVVPRLSGIVE
ncbi:MAG: efflux transporter periplasmic adaptor subunit, partial [Gammaproteobacteria bacterium]